MIKSMSALTLCILLGLVLAACTFPAKPMISTPVIPPTPTIFPESLGPQAAPLCEAAFSDSARVSMEDWPMTPMLLIVKEDQKWAAYRLSLPAVAAQSASEVKTLICMRPNAKKAQEEKP